MALACPMPGLVGTLLECWLKRLGCSTNIHFIHSGLYGDRSSSSCWVKHPLPYPSLSEAHIHGKMCIGKGAISWEEEKKTVHHKNWGVGKQCKGICCGQACLSPPSFRAIYMYIYIYGHVVCMSCLVEKKRKNNVHIVTWYSRRERER
jgi:hypothetical protein